MPTQGTANLRVVFCKRDPSLKFEVSSWKQDARSVWEGWVLGRIWGIVGGYGRVVFSGKTCVFQGSVGTESKWFTASMV